MSLETVFNRKVWLIKSELVSVKDEYGNDVHRQLKVGPFRSRRSRLSADESTDGRDQQTQEWTYLLPAGVILFGYDRILDGEEVLEVIGTPEPVENQLGVHHVEARARLIKG